MKQFVCGAVVGSATLWLVGQQGSIGLLVVALAALAGLWVARGWEWLAEFGKQR